MAGPKAAASAPEAGELPHTPHKTLRKLREGAVSARRPTETTAGQAHSCAAPSTVTTCTASSALLGSIDMP